MKLSISDGTFYVDNIRLCFCEAGNERENLPDGRFEVATEYSHAHGCVLPDAINLGWIGPLSGCDVVLGSVRGRDGLVPSSPVVGRLLALLEVAEGRGEAVWLEIAQ